MKLKSFIIGLVVILAAVAGVIVLIRSHSTSATSDEDENTPTVVRVQTGTLKRMTLNHYISGYGTVEPAAATATDPAADALLSAAQAGVVAKVAVVEGQQVKKGDVLVELNSGGATAEFVAQEADRQRQLYAQGNASLKSLQDAESQLASLQIVSPLSGTVVHLNVKPGASVDVSTVAAEVIDLGRLQVTAGIPASDAGDLKVGEEVEVNAPGTPPVKATVSFLSPAVDAGTGTVQARATLPADSGLRVGQFVPLRIVTATHTNCLAAPEESAITDEQGQTVIALVKGDEATRVPVEAGFRENGWVEIAGTNIEEGDKVVTIGAYGLPEKTKVIVAGAAGGESPDTNSPAGSEK